MFQHVDAYAGDPILSLVDAFGRTRAATRSISALVCITTSRAAFRG